MEAKKLALQLACVITLLSLIKMKPIQYTHKLFVPMELAGSVTNNGFLDFTLPLLST